MPDHEPPDFRLLPDAEEFEPLADAHAATPGRALSGPWRLAAVGLVAALLAGGGVLQWHRAAEAKRTSQHRAQAAAAARPPIGQAGGAGMPSQQWPSAATGPCGGPGQLLPILSSKPLTETTSVRLQVGSDGVRTVQLDEGTVSAAPQVMLREGSLVLDQRTVGGTRYLVVNSCEGGLRSMRQGPGQLAASAVGSLASSSLFGDAANGVWVSTFSPGSTLAEAKLQVTMARLDRPGEFLLPANSFPIAFNGHLVVCEALTASGAGPEKLIVYDTVRHRIVLDLGPMTTVTHSRDQVIWTSEACSAASSCPLHRYDGQTGQVSVRRFGLPEESGVTGAVLSPDGKRLAFQLARMTSDPRYRTNISGSPSDLVVLDLGSGILEPVPNLELPPGTAVGLDFSQDSRWLVIGLTSNSGAQLLLWRSGLTAALASRAKLHGPVPDPLPFRVLADQR